VPLRTIGPSTVSCGWNWAPHVSCTQWTGEQAAALLAAELDLHRGRSPVFLVPVECTELVRSAYAWGARNCEIHFSQVLGEWRPLRGVLMPTFLPETA
jgi:hypothetical protein